MKKLVACAVMMVLWFLTGVLLPIGASCGSSSPVDAGVRSPDAFLGVDAPGAQDALDAPGAG